MADIKYLVMDVDGTLTDGKIYMGQDGEIFKAFDIKDGCGVYLILPQYNITPVIITARKSRIVENRCKELNISELYQSSKDKLQTLIEVLNKENASMSSVAYIGDDLPDIPCMKRIKQSGGVVLCPLDAINEIKDIADYVSNYRAGEGAVRDCIEYLLYREKDNNDIQEKIKSVLSMILSGEFEDKPSGTLADGTPYSIKEYLTKDDSDCLIESHRNHIDVQYIISGQEKLTLYNKAGSINDGKYDEDTDTDIWTQGYPISESILIPGSIIIISNNQLHKGAVSFNKANKVKKIVCKIEVKP